MAVPRTIVPDNFRAVNSRLQRQLAGRWLTSQCMAKPPYSGARTMYTARVAGILLLIGGIACASSGSGAAQAGRPDSRTDRNILRTADLTEAQKDLTVLQVVRQLRPHFLSGSGAMTTGNAGLIVYQ